MFIQFCVCCSRCTHACPFALDSYQLLRCSWPLCSTHVQHHFMPSDLVTVHAHLSDLQRIYVHQSLTHAQQLYLLVATPTATLPHTHLKRCLHVPSGDSRRGESRACVHLSSVWVPIIFALQDVHSAVLDVATLTLGGTQAQGGTQRPAGRAGGAGRGSAAFRAMRAAGLGTLAREVRCLVARSCCDHMIT